MAPVVAEHTMGPVESKPFVQPRFLFWNVSPLTRRRIDQFKANKRGYYSLIVFAAVFVLSWFAELVANDKPLLIRMNGRTYFPVLADYTSRVHYTEKDFGGLLPTEPDYLENYFGNILTENNARVVWPPIRFHHSTVDKQLPPGVAAPAAPGHGHLLGTDESARDVLARILYGIRESVVFALILTALAATVGILAGAVQGYYGGKIDLFMQRFIEIWGSLPQLFIIIIVASIVEPSLVMLIVLLLLFRWIGLSGLVRAEFLRVRNFEYVKAARALGVRDRTIILRHALPNAMISAITFLPFQMSGAVVVLTSLDFLGYGLPPGQYARLGELLNQGKNNPGSPWLTFSTFLTIAGLLMLLVFVGEAFRDAFDPRKTQR